MFFSFSRISRLFLAALLSMAMVGCASKKRAESMTDMNMANFELYADSDSMKAGALQTVHFPYDSSRITNETAATLHANVAFLKQFPSVKIQVEGHCDERGSVQYNLALGERRAKSVRDFLVSQGIDSGRLSIISYGKERPLEFGHTKSAWAKNRRANFVIVEK